jgi:hypothetical protein
MADEWKEHLNSALDQAFEVSKPWAHGTREAIFEHRKKKFEELADKWKDKGEEVLEASRLAGLVARVVADFDLGVTKKVTAEHMKAGIAAAHVICKARLVKAGADASSAFFLFWCE